MEASLGDSFQNKFISIVFLSNLFFSDSFIRKIDDHHRDEALFFSTSFFAIERSFLLLYHSHYVH